MKQDSIVVRSNPSLAFMLMPFARNYMNAIFLQLKECCQEERMEISVNLVNKNLIINSVSYALKFPLCPLFKEFLVKSGKKLKIKI